MQVVVEPELTGLVQEVEPLLTAAPVTVYVAPALYSYAPMLGGECHAAPVISVEDNCPVAVPVYLSGDVVWML